jgi:hypothetical protein
MPNAVNVRRMVAVAATPLLLAGLVACGPDANQASADRSATPSRCPSAPETSSITPLASTTDEPSAGAEIDPQDFLDRLLAGFGSSTTAQIAMVVDTTGLAMSAHGQVDYTGDTPAMALKMTAPAIGEGTIDLRLIHQVMYMSLPMLDPSGKFFRVDLSDPNNPLGDSLGDLSSFDPQSTIQTFSKCVKSVKVVGDETIDGDATTHYQVTASTQELAGNIGAATAGVDLPDVLTYDVWLDSQSRMRKFTADVGKQNSIQMMLTNWGEPVVISAPRADQVQDMPGS